MPRCTPSMPWRLMETVDQPQGHETGFMLDGLLVRCNGSHVETGFFRGILA